jgi:cyclophilin family peptidyl-prolyl cis-trans isomerase/protein-disulfide isomerase
MKRVWPIIVILSALILAACGSPAQSPVNTAVPTVKPTATAAAQAVVPTVQQPTAIPIPGGCQVASLLPAPDPVFPPITDADWQKGPKNALITLLVYSDFQCPFCAQVSPTMDDLVQKFPQDLRIVYRHFPLNIHDKSIASAQLAEAAGLQGKFWEMHTLLMSKQADWEKMNPQEFTTWIKGQSTSISGLDVIKLMADMLSKPVADKVKAALNSAESIGIDQTPFFVLNGRAFGGAPDEASMRSIIQMFKAVATTVAPLRVAACPPQTIDSKKQYTATITTTKGDFTMQLFADKAPLAVNSFVYLARRDWFNNTPFHRVIDGFVAQGGDPSGTGLGNPGYEFNDEISDLKFDKTGMVGLANSGPNTNGSQFFITYVPIPQLDGSYTIFGQVTDGMDILKQLTRRDPQIGAANLPEPDRILNIKIEEK